MQVLNWVLGLCVCLLVASCGESEKERLSRLVSEWEGKEILFPTHSTFTIQGKDTVDFDFRDAEYKIVSYTDSTGCTACKLQLKRWKDLMSEVDSLSHVNVDFLMYFHPKDMKELRYLTRRDGFTHPVCFDEKDDFNRLNRLPSESMFQTFLLDKENRVIALGDPIQNPKVKELYFNLINGNGQIASKNTLTEVSIDHTVMDLGSFPMSEKQECSFVLTNTGNNLLVIQDITTSCGCTKVEYSKEPVRPGETLKVIVTYEVEQAEHFNKSLMVYCNTKKSPIRLTVKGNANS